MKNLNFYLQNSRNFDGGRLVFLDKIETAEIPVEARIKMADAEAETIVEGTKIKLGTIDPKAKDLPSNPAKKTEDKTKTVSQSSEKTPDKEDKENNDKKWTTESFQKLVSDETVSYVKENSKINEVLNDIENNKELTVAELFTKLQGTVEEMNPHSYRDHLNNIIKSRGIPANALNNAKIGGVVGLLAFTSNEGDLKESALKALRWGVGAAIVSHPIITGTLAHIMKPAGNVLGTAAVALPNFIAQIIDDPAKIIDALKRGTNGKTDYTQTPIYKLLMHNETLAGDLGKAMAINPHPVNLLNQGMKFSSDLEEVILFMRDYKSQKGNPSFQTIQKAAKFMVQSEDLALSEKQLENFRQKLWNDDPLSPEDRRQYITTYARQEINKFFTSRKKLRGFYTTEIEGVRGRLNLDPADPNLIKKFAKNNLDQLVGIGQSKELKEMSEKIPHGAENLLRSPGKSVLKFIAIAFTLFKLVMGGSKLFQKGVTELKEKPAKKIGKILAYPFTKTWGFLIGPFARGSKRRRMSKFALEHHKNWSPEQKDAFNSLSRKDKNKVAEKFFEKVKSKDQALDNELAALMKKYKKDKNFWQRLKAGKEYKKDPDYEIIKQKIKERDLNKFATFTDEEWEDCFSVISDKKKLEIILGKNKN